MSRELDLAKLDGLLQTESFGRAVAYERSVGSTMEQAATAARSGATEGFVAIAEEQTAGRGRLGRSWISPPGENLYLTIVVRPTMAQLRQLAVVTPLAVCRAIEEETALLPRIKWPNDVLLAGKKVCGNLVDSEITADAVDYALIGAGINVNLDAAAHSEIREIATSLRTELGFDVERESLLAATLNYLEEFYLAVGRGDVVSVAWKQRLDTLGQHVRVEDAGGHVEEGVAVDADSDGSLIVRRDDGSHVRIEAGDVTLRDPSAT